jgi:archaetidylinositol phosphate synthase
VLTRIKQRLEKIVEPIGNLFVALGLSPNQITVLGFLLGAVAVATLAFTGSFPIFLCLFAFAGLMDAIDGYVARKTNRATSFGAFLDSTLDRATDALTVLPLYTAGLTNTYEALLLVTGEFLVSYTRARAESLGVKMAGVGLAERAERLIAKVAIYLLLALNHRTPAYILFWALVAATYYTVAQRITHTYKTLTRPQLVSKFT